QAHYQELEAIRKQRRQLIHERLFGLGWTAEDFRVHETYIRDWNALVVVARPLSDMGRSVPPVDRTLTLNLRPIACTTMIPKLTRFLEGSRQAKGRDTRRNRAKDLLIEYSQNAHPFSSILTPFSGTYIPPQLSPLPDMNTLLGWGLIRDLYESEISVDVVNERFKERILKLEHRLAAWQAETEKRLIDNLNLERKPGPEIRGETNTTAELPANTRFLLRADTVFIWSDFGVTPPIPLYYPYLLFSSGCSRASDTIPRNPTELSKLRRHTEAEKITKALLTDMNKPDVAYIELKEMGARFTCLRCYPKGPSTWEGMIEHYKQMNKKWQNETRRRPKQTTKHKIIFTNAHELRPGAGSGKERLIRSERTVNNDQGDSHKVECKLCLVGWPSTTYDCMPAITQHLRNV
ncbi:hypothetical protein FRC12_014456, partial [Ceratobasidium sp. 428]